MSRLAAVLQAYDLSVWWDYGLEAGLEFEKQLRSKLSRAKVICPLWCAESVRSEWVQKEAEIGLRRGRLFPVRLQQVSPPIPFADVQAHDLVGWDGAVDDPRLSSLVTSIGRRAGRKSTIRTDLLVVLGRVPPERPLPAVDVPMLSLEEHEALVAEVRQETQRTVTSLGLALSRHFQSHARNIDAALKDLLDRHPEGDRDHAVLLDIQHHHDLLSEFVKIVSEPTSEADLEAIEFAMQPFAEGVSSFARRLIKPPAHFVAEIAPAISTAKLLADHRAIEYAVINILANAADAVHGLPNGTVKLRFATRTSEEASGRGHRVLGADRFVVIEVVDNGPGISLENHDRVFVSDYRTAASKRRSAKGRGVGLTMSHQNVRRSGGEIMVESRPGEGSAFYVYLPLMGT